MLFIYHLHKNTCFCCSTFYLTLAYYNQSDIIYKILFYGYNSSVCSQKYLVRTKINNNKLMFNVSYSLICK